MTNSHSTKASTDHLDLSDPIWAIEHLATAFGVEVDTAREYSYHADFPAPKALFAKNLWARTEVLAWFDRLPGRNRTATRRTRRTTESPRVQWRVVCPI